jgi:outer membrane lipoprotein-sorting protein
MGLLSTVNMKKCIQQQRDYYAAIVAELDAKLAAMEESEADVTQNTETQNNKRRRV